MNYRYTLGQTGFILILQRTKTAFDGMKYILLQILHYSILMTATSVWNLLDKKK